MKQLLLLPLLFTALAFAQPWRPVPANGEWFHYSADTAGYPTHLLSVDSVTLAGSDTVYHLSPTHVPEGPARWWKQSFAGRTATAAPGGIWTLAYDSSSLVLHTLAQPGAQWTSGSQTVTLLSAGATTTFGLADSVKSFVAGGDTFVLSRQVGLLHMPALGGEPGFTLTGVDHGRKLGEQVPDLFDYYDFAVGNVFYRKKYSIYFDGTPHEVGSLTKTTVLAATAVNDTLTEYQIYVSSVEYSMEQNMGGGYEPHYRPLFQYQDTLQIAPHSADVLLEFGIFDEFRPNVFRPDPVSSNGLGGVNRLSRDSLGHMEFAQYPGFFTQSVRLPLQGVNGETKGPAALEDLHNAFAVGLGRTEYYKHIFENTVGEKLLGYLKNGVQWGEIPTDVYLGALHVDANPAAFTLAPNPANTHVALTLTDDARPGTAALLDLQGREIRQTAVAGGTAQLETADLPAGLYLLRVQTETGAATQKVMIQH